MYFVFIFLFVFVLVIVFVFVSIFVFSEASDLQVGVVETKHFCIDEEEGVVADKETADPQNELAFKHRKNSRNGNQLNLNRMTTCEIPQLRQEQI